MIQLGDLSRYRESEVPGNKANWLPAIGYYDLARFVLPESGIPYNQIATIALADGDLFHALYWIYRALSVNEPHSQAHENLKRAFVRVDAAFSDGKLQESNSQLVFVFLCLLSNSQTGRPEARFGTLEAELETLLTMNLEESQPSSLLREILLTSFSATHCAQETLAKAQGAGNSFDAFVLALRITLRLVCTLLKDFEKGLQVMLNSMTRGTQSSYGPELLSASAVSLTRLCMLWAMRNQNLLTNRIYSDVDALQDILWQRIADSLSLLDGHVTLGGFPILMRSLYEDEDTVAYKPLSSESTNRFRLNTQYLEKIAPESHGHNASNEAGDTWVRTKHILQIGIEMAHDKVPCSRLFAALER